MSRKIKLLEPRFWRNALNCPQVMKDVNLIEIQADLKRQLFDASSMKKKEIM